MSVFNLNSVQRWSACMSVALVCGCGTAPSDSTWISTTPSTGPSPNPSTGASPPSGGGVFGPGGIFGRTPDPNATPEAYAASQLEELADALSRELRGTPVEVQRADPNLLRVAVPANYCFDAGRSSVKQPLAAVLDRMAAQLKLKPDLEVVLAGPADARDSDVLLAQDRAAAARDYLISRGVSAARFAVLDRPTIAGLEIRITARKGLRGGAEPARLQR